MANKLYETLRNKFLNGHQDLENLEGLTKQGFALQAK
jgi:hypothetical protein